MQSWLRQFLSTVLVLGAWLLAAAASAHDIPGRATVLAYVQPQDQRVLVLVRVPMESLTELQFPTLGPGYLDLARADPVLADAARMYVLDALTLFDDGKPLTQPELLRARFAPIGDRSFTELPSALALVQSPRLPDTEEIYWKQGWLDTLIAYPLAQPAGKLELETRLRRLGDETRTVLHFAPPNGPERVFTYVGDRGRIDLEPGFWSASTRFVALGFSHILEGIDHLLFLFCLIVVARSIRTLVPVITAFTIAHTITLVSAALGLTPTALWFAPLIETLIALSILYMACENVLGIQGGRRWMLVFAFGLIHGFGFSFILADRMQFAGEHLLSALLAFNIGVELGQLAVLCLLVPLLRLLFRYLPSERVGVILLSAFAAHSAWHWFTERGEDLLQYDWQAPVLDAAFLAAAMRWGMLLIASVAVGWGLSEVLTRFGRRLG